jgi:hypothetical protein
MTDRHLSVIFCDDVRQEINGKLTLVGCYGAEMLVTEFPLMLPKLCVTMSAETTVSNPFKSIAFAVVDEHEVEYARAEISEDDLAKFSLNIPNGDDANKAKYAINSIIQLPIFSVDKPTKLRTVAYSDGEPLRGRPLRIRLATQDELQKLA